MIACLEDCNFWEIEYEEWHYLANILIFELIHTNKQFCKDDFIKKARYHEMPPDYIRALSFDIFREFERVGYIRQSNSVNENECGALWKE